MLEAVLYSRLVIRRRGHIFYLVDEEKIEVDDN